MAHRRLSRPLVLSSALALVGSLGPGLARADDASCIAASEQGLSLRKAGKLHEALEQLAICAAPSCPDIVKTACANRIAAVNAAMPTLVLSATDGAGDDLHDVKVSLDGAPLVSSLDGRPIAIDPGSHTLRFERSGQPPVDKTLVLLEGDKDRRESVVLGPARAPAPVTPPPSAASAPHPGWWTTQRALAVAGAGLGVAGLAVGGVFGAFAISDRNQERTNCSPGSCPNQPQAKADYDTGSQNATVSTIAFVAGAAFLAAGVLLFFTAHDAQATPTVGSLYLAPSTTGRGPGLVLGGEL